MDTFLVYLIFVAEGIKNNLSGFWQEFFGGCGVLLLFLGFVYVIIKIICSSDNDWNEKEEETYNRFLPKIKKLGFSFVVISFCMSMMASVIPTAKQSAVIYIIPKIINNQNMTQIPDNLAKLVNEGLKELTSMVKKEGGELAKEVKKEVKEVISNKKTKKEE